MKRQEIEKMVIKAAKTIAEQNDIPSASIKTSTCLFGEKGCFDSLSIVHLLIELEERLETDHGIKVVLSDEFAMAKNSPFRSPKTLTDKIEKLLTAGKA